MDALCSKLLDEHEIKPIYSHREQEKWEEEVEYNRESGLDEREEDDELDGEEIHQEMVANAEKFGTQLSVGPVRG